jgi:hypothetical protein
MSQTDFEPALIRRSLKSTIVGYTPSPVSGHVVGRPNLSALRIVAIPEQTMVYLNWLWTPGWAWPHDAPILFLLICVIALTSLFSFLGLWGLALRFRRRSEQTDKEIASLHDEILLLKIRVNGLVRR